MLLDYYQKLFSPQIIPRQAVNVAELQGGKHQHESSAAQVLAPTSFFKDIHSCTQVIQLSLLPPAPCSLEKWNQNSSATAHDTKREQD